MNEKEFSKIVILQAQLEMTSSRQTDAQEKLRKLENNIRDLIKEDLTHEQLLEKLKSLVAFI